MSLLLLHPSVVLLIGALMMLLADRRLARIIATATPFAAMMLIYGNIHMPVQSSIEFDALGATLQFYSVRTYSHVFAVAFGLLGAMGMLYAAGYAELRLRYARAEMCAALLYIAGALGVCYAGDWITLLLWWELLAIASTIIILCGDTSAARAAAFRYMLMHLLGGVVMLSGVTMVMMGKDTSTITSLTGDLTRLWYSIRGDGVVFDSASIGAGLVLVGVLLNAAMPPASAWLPDSYPHASPSGAVFLSGLTTKSAVFVLMLIAPGLDILVMLGLAMAWYGILYSVREDVMRKVLSYSIITQVGVMIAVIGIGSELAMAGVAAHAMVNVIYKGVLFITVGNVIAMTGRHQISELGGLFRAMPLTGTCAMIGALTMLAAPLTAAFETKSMMVSAAANEVYLYAWFVLIAIAAASVIQAAIFWQIFFHRDAGLRPKEPTLWMRIGTLLMTATLVMISLNPTWFLSEPIYDAYKAEHITAQLQIISAALIVYFLALYHTKLVRRKPNCIKDIDWIYRHLLMNMIKLKMRAVMRIIRAVQVAVRALRHTISIKISHNCGNERVLMHRWSLAPTLIYTLGLLLLFLILYYARA